MTNPDVRKQRGKHDIEKEMTFKNNPLFLVHDSEGFEAGRKDEFNVVQRFIESRSRREKINERLHAIWYNLFSSHTSGLRNSTVTSGTAC